MKNRSDPVEESEELWEKLIGLGETSHHKCYYPELQKRLEELERFKAFLDYANDAIFLVEVPSGLIVDFNQTSISQCGFTSDELRQLSIFEVTDIEDHQEACVLISETGKSKRREMVETPLRCKDGSRIPSELTLARMRFQDKDYVIVVARNISKRKEAEEALLKSEKRRVRLQTQLDFAAKVQARLLPDSLPDLPGFEVAARCQPAWQVGGDFYDLQQTGPGRYALTLGDVMGKGLPAAMLMATVRASLRAVARIPEPDEALRQAEPALRQDLDNSESFVTLFHARLELPTRRLTYVDCGHGLVYMLRANGKVEELLPRGLPLGVPSPEPFQAGSKDFYPGDALVLFSDGLLEVILQREIDDGALGKKLWSCHAREMVNRLVPEKPPENIEDDMTLVVIKCTGPETIPLFRH
ncbi:MAG: SpoIIE family protein phosphatase [Syntrophotaleaceae bacterium]